jgi:hypothetical protein
MLSRRRSRALLLLLSCSLPAVLLPAACGGSRKSAGAGEDCFRDADCVEGLVCVAGACTSDVTPIVPEVRERPMANGGTDAMGATGAGGSGAMPGAGGSSTATTTTGVGGVGGSGVGGVGGSGMPGAGGSGVSGTGNEAGATGAE